jgi:transcriptional regulator with XRE-family HTH domain
MVSISPASHPKRVPKRKASAYADTLFETQKEALARSLVRLRLGQGLSQEALAYEAEVERSYVSLLQRGQGNPSLRVVCQLAQRLGVSVVDMVGGTRTEYAPLNSGSSALLLQEPRPEGLTEKDRAATAAPNAHP